MRGSWSDLRQVIRTLARNPALVTTVTLVLGCGIAASTTVFTLVNAVLLRPLPVTDPHRLRFLYSVSTQGTFDGVSLEVWEAMGAHQHLFSDIAATAPDVTTWRSGQLANPVYGQQVTANFFTVLGVTPAIGRTLADGSGTAPEDHSPVVISHELWQARFDSSPSVIGHALPLDIQRARGLHGAARTYVIVGVMPPGFSGTCGPWRQCDYWVPLESRSRETREVYGEDWVRYVRPVGRLHTGVSDAQARSALAVLASQLRSEFFRNDPRWNLVAFDSTVSRLPFDPRGAINPARLAAGMLVAASLVLLIAVANVVGILLARGVSRSGEVCIRLALGASPLRVMRRFVAEGLLLAVLGGVVGMLLSRGFLQLFARSLPDQVGVYTAVRITLSTPVDERVVVFTLASCFAAGLAAGLLPATRARRVDLVAGLTGGGASTTASTSRGARSWLVAGQLALALVLLALAGTVVVAMVRSGSHDPGYRPTGVVFTTFSLPAWPRSATPAEFDVAYQQRREYYRRLLERARRSDVLTAAGVAEGLPTAPRSTHVIARDGVAQGESPVRTRFAEVTAGYFDVLGVKVIRGRIFEDGTGFQSRKVAVVCEALARAMWPKRDAIGEHIGFQTPGAATPSTWYEVIGIVAEVKPPLTEGEPNPTIYLHLEQSPYPFATAVVARGRGSARDLIRELGRITTESSPDVLIAEPRLLTEAIDSIRFPQRATASILGLSGVAALALAAVGLYGLVSFSVALRLPELGIRMALGADGGAISRLVVVEGTKLGIVGSLAGLALAGAAHRAATAVSAAWPRADVLTFVAAWTLLSGVVLVASYIPARRAASLDPKASLRRL